MTVLCEVCLRPCLNPSEEQDELCTVCLEQMLANMERERDFQELFAPDAATHTPPQESPLLEAGLTLSAAGENVPQKQEPKICCDCESYCTFCKCKMSKCIKEDFEKWLETEAEEEF